MKNKQVNQNILADLQKANKYIFVQDFEKAERILQKLSWANLENYEILFKRVEVAVKKHSLDELFEELSGLQAQNPACKPLLFACVFLKIKSFAVKRHAEESMEFMDKLNLGNTVKGLDNPFAAKGEYFSISSPYSVFLPNKKLKINRSALVPDDFNLNSENFQTFQKFKKNPMKFCVSQSFKDIDKEQRLAHIESVLEVAWDFHKEDPQNPSAWFLAGCAFEYAGKIDDAIEKWKHAFDLDSNSVSILSALAELQQLGYVVDSTIDYGLKFESIDKYLVHGHFETHTELYNEFIQNGEYKSAIGSLRTFADWLQKKYGEVPIEVEILCLLGAMNAYKLDKNSEASNACKNEVENMVITYKKSTPDQKKLVFIANLCEEYGLKPLSKMCYFHILTSKVFDLELLVQVASRCVNLFPSESLLECLKIAHKNSDGNVEIHFCQLLCSLEMNGINVVEYMEDKNKIRVLVSQNKSAQAFVCLQSLVLRFSQDPEVHYYLAEIYFRLGKLEESKFHFVQMYHLDPFHVEGSLRYTFFLLKNKNYETMKQVVQKILSSKTVSTHQLAEFHWRLATCYFLEENYDLAHIEILKSLENEAWNPNYIILFLRIALQKDTWPQFKEKEAFIQKFEEFILKINSFQPSETKETLLEKCLKSCAECMQHGYSQYAWIFAKSSLILNKKMTQDISFFLSKAGAACEPHLAVKQMLLLLRQNEEESKIGFSDIASCIAHIYGYNGEWPLVDTWLGIAQSGTIIDDKVKSKIFELQALSLAMQGNNLRKAQNLLEAAMDFYANAQKVPFDTKVLHGYVLVAQGQIAAGLEKMKDNMTHESSIQSFYFLVKGLERAGKLLSLSKESLDQMCQAYPVNHFEQKMVEEIFYTVGLKIERAPLGLVC